jgi:multicomponent K+:H+ antiporter subunit E
MKRRIPLLLASALLCLWLLLNDTLELGHILLGTLIAVLLALGVASMRPLQARMRRLSLLIKLIFTVLLDIVRSNIAVARVILGLVRDREVKSGFLDIPLDLRDPHGLAGLAMIVTSTPGTVWAELTPDGSTLMLHVLDLRDEAALIRTIKQRYEQPLREIFE